MTTLSRILSILVLVFIAQSASAYSPIGNLEDVNGVGGGIFIKGWTLDQDTTSSIYIWVTVDGVGQHVHANVSRPDVEDVYPSYGDKHGFSKVISASPGSHHICVTASNVGSGSHVELGCRDVVVPSGSPFGQFDSVAGLNGAIEISGWAIDPDTTDPIYAWVTIDGVGQHVYANKTRTDVGRAYLGYGDNHGFSAVLNASPGPHTVCITASNVNSGSHTSLGCKQVDVPNGEPFGNLEYLSSSGNNIEIEGWAIDPDTTAPIYVWVTIDGVGQHVYADDIRTDVGDANPGYGDNHGFSASIPASDGFHQVCVTASNVQNGSHTELGCKAIAVGNIPGGSPFGNFESISTTSNGIRVKGWAIDPDTAGPVYVWVTVDGVGQHILANKERKDVGKVHVGYGNNHGFDSIIPTSPGFHTVCATISNTGVGSHKDLGCKTIGPPPNQIPDSGWTRPLANYYVSQEFKGASVHNGIDLAKAYGSTVYAARAGRVKDIKYGYCQSGVNCWSSGSGWQLDPVYFMSGDKVVIEHADGMLSIYDHCEPLDSLYIGEHVSKDQAIGKINRTGNRTGAHLHFAIFSNSSYYSPVNPRNYINF